METAVVYRWATMFLVVIHCRFSPSEVKTSQFAVATVATKVQTVEKVVEVPMVGQTLQGTTQEVDIPLAPRREDLDGDGMGWILIRQQAPLLAVSFLVLTIVSAMILFFFGNDVHFLDACSLHTFLFCRNTLFLVLGMHRAPTVFSCLHATYLTRSILRKLWNRRLLDSTDPSFALFR